MKKLLLILCMVFAFVYANSQVIYLSDQRYYKSYTGVAGDTASGTTAKNFDIQINPSNGLYFYSVEVDVDSLGDGTNFTVELEGSNDGTNFYDISSLTWYVTASDTTIRFSNSTYTEVTASHTQILSGTHSIASYTEIGDSTRALSDTITVAAQTITLNDTVTVAAATNTVTYPGVFWKELRVKFTGAGANAKCEIEAIRAKAIKKD